MGSFIAVGIGNTDSKQFEILSETKNAADARAEVLTGVHGAGTFHIGSFGRVLEIQVSQKPTVEVASEKILSARKGRKAKGKEKGNSEGKSKAPTAQASA